MFGYDRWRDTNAESFEEIVLLGVLAGDAMRIFVEPGLLVVGSGFL